MFIIVESLNCDVGNPGDSLENFRKLCEDIAAEKSYLVKTKKVSSLLKEGPEGGINHMYT